MVKIKRMARKMPKEHKNLDIMKPLLYENLGSADDPCFGNYSAKAEECKRCGDSEICAAVSTNKLLLDIDKVEANKPFKDTDEANLVDEQNLTITKSFTKLSKKEPDIWLKIKDSIPIFTHEFNLTEKDKPVLFQRCIKAIRDSKKLKLNKKLTKYKLK